MILGVILAGGRGMRLGGAIKANLEIAGRTLGDRAAEALHMQCDAVVLSTGRIEPQAFTLKTQMPKIPDAPQIDAGPVGGLSAAIAWCRTQPETPQFVITVAVDTPFFPQNFAQLALDLMQPDVNCVVGCEPSAERRGLQTFPTNSLWRFAAIADLPERLETPEAPHGLRNVVPATNTALLEYPALTLDGCFFNVNTPADIQLATTLAQGRAAEAD